MSDEKPAVFTVTGLQMDDLSQPLRVLEYAKPTHRLQFYGDNNVLVATIHPDGRVEFGPGYTTDDDVSRRLWTCFGQLPAKLAKAEQENSILRGFIAKSDLPCVYCNLPKAETGKCPSGFPGCARMDDLMAAEDL